MGSRNDHIRTAGRHYAVSRICRALKLYDWWSVACCYGAIHLVEALRCCDHDEEGYRHSTDHESRKRYIQQKRRYLYRDFKFVFDQAWIARYLDAGAGSRTLQTGADVADLAARSEALKSSIQKTLTDRFQVRFDEVFGAGEGEVACNVPEVVRIALELGPVM